MREILGRAANCRGWLRVFDTLNKVSARRVGVYGVLALAGLATPVLGAVTALDVFYTRYYYQFSGSPPTVPYSYYYAARLTADQPGDVATATLTLPGGVTTYPMPNVGPGSFLVQQPFFDDAGLLAAFPAGEYVCNASGGTLGPVQVSVTRNATAYWPDTVPAYTSGSVTAMIAANAGVDLGLEFNAWTPPAPAEFGINFIVVYDAFTNAVAYSMGFSAADTAHAIPAGTLAPGKRYNAFLYFSSRSQIFDGTLNRLVAFDHATYANLETVACVGDLNRDGSVDDGDFTVFVPGYNVLLCSEPAMAYGCPADLNRDGTVDDADFVIFAAAYDTLVCP